MRCSNCFSCSCSSAVSTTFVICNASYGETLSFPPGFNPRSFRGLSKALDFREDGRPRTSWRQPTRSDSLHHPTRLRTALLWRATLPMQVGQLRRQPAGVPSLCRRPKFEIRSAHLRQRSVLLREPMHSQWVVYQAIITPSAWWKC